MNTGPYERLRIAERALDCTDSAIQRAVAHIESGRAHLAKMALREGLAELAANRAEIMALRDAEYAKICRDMRAVLDAPAAYEAAE